MGNGNTKRVRVLIAAVCCLTLLGGCSQQTPRLPDASSETTTASQEEKAVYQAKIAYYEGQLQLLETQLQQMDDEMLSLREEYLREVSSMQSELQALRDRAPATTNEQSPAQDSEDEHAAKAPSSGDESRPDDQTPPVASVQPDTPRQGATSVYTYQEENGGVVLIKYTGADTHLTIPAAVDGKKVIALADHAFSETGVVSVRIPETVRTLGWFTFYGCSDLKEVTLPASVKNIGYASFDGCDKDLTLIVSEGSYAQKYAASFAMRYEVE